ncbi:hypothetical protein A2671_00545 [Candidatus Kaiserbacteria bacterium RIFCSPHIGHO2_01_FULL_49_13]|uniref:Helicase ATP-binding domain-containing protein n=1 Tax=Candidatus Kaiserbacteria bacterium RIFCSPHIGHO2_01_FULL_49_13 TaxID=1798477 RepID=A0A1F6CDE1_9BACT|nr:MAG: hypothetical protein A2671_00545 [Candidatus Kaiserbacteria bacterium RIFCSPHIGHO2_01_FULL_49_13]
MFNPLPFQQDTIENLLQTFARVWKQKQKQLPLVFRSPTGSGKTFMAAHFIRGLNKLPNWDEDKAFIWITFSDDLAMQSKRKFEEYFENTVENNLLTVNDFNRGKLFKNDILFLNWQKIVSRAAESRVLRRPDDERMLKESGKYFEDVIDGTKKEKRAIILIIDEAHTHVRTALAQQIVDYVDPKIVLHISATPDNDIELAARRLGSFVEVLREKVVEQGLIKEKVVTQTEEDLKKYKNKDLDQVLLDLGIEKRKQVKKELSDLGKNINPLMLIQLPNDDKSLVELGQKTKEEIVLQYLNKSGVKEKEIALWFDGKQKNMEFITDNDSEVNYMLFKQAAGTGWDCPRAHVLVMFREIQSPTFYTQTVGRMLRMPDPQNKEDYKNSPNLKTGFLLTNYKRDEVGVPDQSNGNKPYIYTSKRRENIKNVELQSAYVSRVDYGDLSNSSKFQRSFLKTFDGYFALSKDDLLGKGQKKLEKKGVDLDSHLSNKVIVDAKFEDYDNLNFEFERQGHDVSLEMSQNDVEKTFNYLCFQLLKEQTEDKAKITNTARSWSPLKSAIRVWIRNILGDNGDYYYRIFIKDIQKGASSVFRPAITQALKDYRPVLEKIVEERAQKNEEKEAPLFTIQENYSYTEDYELKKTSRNALEDFYIRKEYDGKKNELEFIDYIDKKTDLDWWFKQDIGQIYFAVKYFNTAHKRDALFYPDWIIRFKDGRIGIFDTKSGFTANTEGRAEELSRKIKALGKKFIGGIVVKENGVWYCNDAEKYSYTAGKLDKNWKKFEELF